MNIALKDIPCFRTVIIFGMGEGNNRDTMNTDAIKDVLVVDGTKLYLVEFLPKSVVVIESVRRSYVLEYLYS